MSDFDTVKKEVKDVILDVDMVLDDITAKAERQVEWPPLDGLNALLKVQDLKSLLVH